MTNLYNGWTPPTKYERASHEERVAIRAGHSSEGWNDCPICGAKMHPDDEAAMNQCYDCIDSEQQDVEGEE